MGRNVLNRTGDFLGLEYKDLSVVGVVTPGNIILTPLLPTPGEIMDIYNIFLWERIPPGSTVGTHALEIINSIGDTIIYGQYPFNSDIIFLNGMWAPGWIGTLTGTYDPSENVIAQLYADVALPLTVRYTNNTDRDSGGPHTYKLHTKRFRV